MKFPKPKRIRQYTTADLVNIAAQLNCRVRFELVPAELPTKPDKPDPKLTVRHKSKRQASR